jgi:serine/threonine protein kinase
VCHARGVLHRDIKLDNILLNEAKTEIKLGDFGVSQKLKPGTKVSDRSGTPAYLAPEVHSRKFYDPVKAEIWSLGVCLYHMLFAKLPFHAADGKELKRLIRRGGYEIPPFAKLAADGIDLIQQLLSPDPKHRPKLSDILQHPWLHATKHNRQQFYSVSFDHRLSLNQKVVTQAVNLGYRKDRVENAVYAGEICPESAAYYMLLSCQ